jgi:hypothetical protein
MGEGQRRLPGPDEHPKHLDRQFDVQLPRRVHGLGHQRLGWTAPIYQKSSVWYLKRTVDAWQPCPDGSAGPGLQVYRFFASAPDASSSVPGSTTLMGDDQTTGVSGSCGSSKVIFISMPFKLVKLS